MKHLEKIIPINRISILAAISILLLVPQTNCKNETYSLKLSTHDLTLIIGETDLFTLELRGFLNDTINITFVKQHENVIDIIPSSVEIEPTNRSNDSRNYSITLLGQSPGHVEVTSKADDKHSWVEKDIFLRVIVARSWPIYYISVIFGWIYFLAWSISFYPQIYENFRRKSVIGLNFDFLSLNIVGFIMYSIFNAGLFWNPEIQAEYSSRFPRGLNPVLINDVFFSFHAICATSITITQCFLYERGEQRVSRTARGILGVFFILVIIFAILAGVQVIHWLDFLYYCSYIKLAITLIKYIPQAVMNYKRKSTIGWSIGNIILDFTGGILSMLQMILNAHNYDDWHSLFGDPTKFGLGFFSVCFDVFFMLQHYVFYRNAQPYNEIPGDTIIDDDNIPENPYRTIIVP